MSSRRPDVDLVSDVLIDLVHEKLISTLQVEAIAKRYWITQDDLSKAVLRRTSVAWRPVVLAREVADGRAHRERTEAKQRPGNMGKPTNSRKKRDVKGVAELWCVGFEGEEPHWASEDDFLVRADYPWRRMSMCDGHRKQYQRARHVKVAARDALSDIGLEFVLDKRSNLIGVQCKECGLQFKSGDEVVGDAALAHKACR